MQPGEIHQESWFEQNSGMIIKLTVFIVLLVVILVSTGYMKKIIVFINPDLTNCQGGTCKSSCIKGVELQKQGAHCADTSKICCILNNRTPSAECANRKQGDPCGKAMACDDYNVCISLCEYCSKYPEDKSCNITSYVGKYVSQFDSNFSCGCTQMDCETFDNSRLGTCVKGFCPSETPGAVDYMCCSTMYTK